MGLLARILGVRRDSRGLASGTRAQGERAGGQWVGASGLGGPHDRAQGDEYVAGAPVDRGLADDLVSTNGVARRIVTREPEDCTREGYDIEGLAPELAERIELWLDGPEGVGALSAVCEARSWARAYGGGAVVMMVDDGQEPDQPIDAQNIRAVRGLLAVDRWELPIVEFGTDPREPRTFARPRMYQLQPSQGGISMRVHRDRVVDVRGFTLPRRLTIRRQGWDASIFDLAYAQLRSYGTSHAYAAEALSLLTQGVLSSPALDAALETEDGPQIVQSRLEAMRLAQGLFGEMAIGERETYEIHARPLTGISDAIKAAVDALVVVSDMPRAVMLGELPGGLGHGEISPELRIWYDHCKSLQPRIYSPAILRILALGLRSNEGPTAGQDPGPFDLAWRPLWQQSDDAQAAIDLKRAQRRATDIASTSVSSDEVRRGDRDLQELYDLDPKTLPPAQAGPDEPGELPAGSPLASVEDNPVEDEGVVALVPEGPSDDPLPDDLVDPRDVAQRLHVPTRTITQWMNRGSLRWWHVGSHRRVSMSEAMALAQRGDASGG